MKNEGWSKQEKKLSGYKHWSSVGITAELCFLAYYYF
ncbi:rCG43261 [Rattus norvegicus]|uniref:RCG43261 n=1 Tax=Rattus norvegicus TaxID=10116 RepID=A6IVY2_RAT|nr:rCG43261 [Rattus norvegicus]